MLSVIFGGASYEHEISIVSTISVKKLLDIRHFIFIDGSKQAYLIDEKNMKSSYFADGGYKEAPKFYFAQGGGMVATRSLLKERLDYIPLGCAINLVHGADGEDGAIAGLLKMHNIHMIGPDIEACALSYNKLLTKGYASALGVNTLAHLSYRAGDDIAALDIEGIGGYPIIIKPARLGSSIGLAIAKDSSQLAYAIDSALEFDSLLILEHFIEDVREFNLAGAQVLNESGKEEFVYSIIEDVQKSSLLKFEDKYLDFNRSDKIAAANISPKIEAELKEAFAKIYTGEFSGALIRCDFFLIDDKVYLNEINPIPGSLANYLFSDFSTIIDALVNSYKYFKPRPIVVRYDYIREIQFAKGK